MINIYLIDDHALIRAAIHTLLEDATDIKIIGESEFGQDGIQQVLTLKPDVVILDYQLSDITGLEITEQLLAQQPQLKILVLSAITESIVPFHLLEAGAKSYITKDSTKEDFIAAIRDTHEGQRIISPEIAKHLALAHVNSQSIESNPFIKLSSQQLKITKEILRGKTNEEIAAKMQLESKSIYNHRSRILKKMELQNDVELTLLAWRHKMLLLKPIEEQA